MTTTTANTYYPGRGGTCSVCQRPDLEYCDNTIGTGDPICHDCAVTFPRSPNNRPYNMCSHYGNTPTEMCKACQQEPVTRDDGLCPDCRGDVSYEVTFGLPVTLYIRGDGTVDRVTVLTPPDMPDVTDLHSLRALAESTTIAEGGDAFDRFGDWYEQAAPDIGAQMWPTPEWGG